MNVRWRLSSCSPNVDGYDSWLTFHVGPGILSIIPWYCARPSSSLSAYNQVQYNVAWLLSRSWSYSSKLASSRPRGKRQHRVRLCSDVPIRVALQNILGCLQHGFVETKTILKHQALFGFSTFSSIDVTDAKSARRHGGEGNTINVNFGCRYTFAAVDLFLKNSTLCLADDTHQRNILMLWCM